MSTAASSLPVDALKFIRTTFLDALTHWGLVTHICVGKPITIGSDSGLSPERRQAIIWINAGILLIGPLGTNFSEILTGIQTFSFKKIHLKMSSGKWRPFCLGLNVLNDNKAVDMTTVSFQWNAFNAQITSQPYRAQFIGISSLDMDEFEVGTILPMVYSFEIHELLSISKIAMLEFSLFNKFWV